MIDITYGAAPSEKTAAALGYFDGLHLAHTCLIQSAMEAARLGKNTASAVFTFNCDTTLPKFQRQEDIISFDDKREFLEKMGVDYLYAPDFAEVCGLSAEDFVSEILVKRLNVGFTICGENFRFGKNGEGTPEKLAELAEKHGFTAKFMATLSLADGVLVDPKTGLYPNAEVISSSHIRELIRNGEIEKANEFLGYELRFDLPVVHGNELGRTISFPTINQIIPETNIIPRFGAYKSYVQIDGKNYRGITNIGIRPTVAGDGKTVMETHILNFGGDLYGKNIPVSLVKFLRDERKFGSLEELKIQISEDIKLWK